MRELPEGSHPMDGEGRLKTIWKNAWARVLADSRTSTLFLILGFSAIFFLATLSFFLIPPSGFLAGTRIVVENGASLGEVSFLLKDKQMIRSRVLFEFCAISLGSDKGVFAGEYLFKEPINGCSLASRMMNGVFGVPAVRVTIPEGLSNKDASVILGKALADFDAAEFLAIAKDKEGYLFPDTYFFPEHATAADVEKILAANFDKKIKPLLDSVAKSGHTLREIVIMASIIEKEVAHEEDRAVVSGILWKRIRIGMPLQVDATFLYLLGKKSSELTLADLQIKSPYNTYRNRGLPAGPIGNPGLSALRAALFPKASPYLYYLADKNGITHYAKTFDEHKANKEKYLW